MHMEKREFFRTGLIGHRRSAKLPILVLCWYQVLTSSMSSGSLVLAKPSKRMALVGSAFLFTWNSTSYCKYSFCGVRVGLRSLTKNSSAYSQFLHLYRHLPSSASGSSIHQALHSKLKRPRSSRIPTLILPILCLPNVLVLNKNRLISCSASSDLPGKRTPDTDL